MHQHVGAGEQVLQPLPPLRGASRRAGRPSLPSSHVRHHRRLVPVGRVDAQHRRAERGERAGRDRAGEHAGEVEHAQPGERPRAGPDARSCARAPCAAGRRAAPAATAAPCGWAIQASADRMVAAAPPASTTAASRSSARPAARPRRRPPPGRPPRRAPAGPPRGAAARSCAAGSSRPRSGSRRRSGPTATAAAQPTGRSACRNHAAHQRAVDGSRPPRRPPPPAARRPRRRRRRPRRSRARRRPRPRRGRSCPAPRRPRRVSNSRADSDCSGDVIPSSTAPARTPKPAPRAVARQAGAPGDGDRGSGGAVEHPGDGAVLEDLVDRAGEQRRDRQDLELREALLGRQRQRVGDDDLVDRRATAGARRPGR